MDEKIIKIIEEFNNKINNYYNVFDVMNDPVLRNFFGTDVDLKLFYEIYKKSCYFKNETEEDSEIRRKYSDATKAGGGASDPKAINTLGHEKQFNDFASAIIENREPDVNAESASEAVKIITAIYESVRSGKKVKVN